MTAEKRRDRIIGFQEAIKDSLEFSPILESVKILAIRINPILDDGYDVVPTFEGGIMFEDSQTTHTVTIEPGILIKTKR